MSPRVTWLIPIRNGMPYLPETLASIEAQTYQNWEVLAWDNGSTDGTSEELRKWIPERLPGRIVTSIPLTVGASLARMVEQCKTELCARIDADDINLPERLEQQVAFLERYPEVAVVGSQAYRIDSSGKTIEKFTKVPLRHRDILDLFLAYNVVLHSSVLFRRSAILAVGNYRDLPNVEDYDLWLWVASRYQLANLDRCLIKHRIHERSTTEKARKQARLVQLTNECLVKHAPALYGCSTKEIQKLRLKRHPCSLLAFYRIAQYLERTQGDPWLERFRSRDFIFSGKELTANHDIISRVIWRVLWALWG